jgi:hypothetical protein
MSDAKTQGFKLPPHANAKVHARIMAKLATMTQQEFCRTAVRAGIYSSDGRLAERYRDPEGEK